MEKTKEAQLLGKALEQYRKDAQRKTRASLAEEAGVDKDHIGRIERGEVSPRFDTIILLCEALGISIEELLKRMREIDFEKKSP